MKLENGTYRTSAGSVLTVSGDHGGQFRVDFDWVEEPEACIDCDFSPVPEWNGENWMLCWTCEFCGGGSARLERV